MRPGQGQPARAALAAGYLALVGFSACSRTDDPLERYASSTTGSVAGTSSSAGGGASAAGGASTVGGSAQSGGRGGSAGEDGSSIAGAPTTDGGSGPTEPEHDCGEPPISSAAFTKKALRGAAADCATWHYCRFEHAAARLELALGDHEAAPDSVTLDTARRALGQAMDIWSEVELFQFGPLASSAEAAARDAKQGQGLRDLIYSWPATVRARVEEQVVNRNYLTGWASDVVLVSARGLFSLDYLLSYPGTDTVCSASSVCGKNWLKYGPNELGALKREYASGVGRDILLRVGDLRERWSAEGGNFRPLFVDATGYDDENQAMTALGWSLLYVEREVKDYKLGVPAGYTINSPVSLPEMPYSEHGGDNIAHNLRGFRALFEGCGAEGEGLGVDDWLSAAGHPELAQDIMLAWRDAQAVADAFPGFSRATPEQLEQLYRAVKALTDLLKNDLFGSGSPLGLTLPKGIEGDTD